MNTWACADALMPLLMIENSQQQRQTAAAVESFRNEMVNFNHIALSRDVETARLEAKSDARV